MTSVQQHPYVTASDCLRIMGSTTSDLIFELPLAGSRPALVMRPARLFFGYASGCTSPVVLLPSEPDDPGVLSRRLRFGERCQACSIPLWWGWGNSWYSGLPQLELYRGVVMSRDDQVVPLLSVESLARRLAGRRELLRSAGVKYYQTAKLLEPP